MKTVVLIFPRLLALLDFLIEVKVFGTQTDVKNFRLTAELTEAQISTARIKYGALIERTMEA